MRAITETALSGPPQKIPQLRAIVQIERSHRAVLPWRPSCASMISSPVVSDSAAKMPPLWNQRTPSAEDLVPVEVAGLQQRAGFIAAVVENDRSANALAAIAIHGRHVRARSRRCA